MKILSKKEYVKLKECERVVEELLELYGCADLFIPDNVLNVAKKYKFKCEKLEDMFREGYTFSSYNVPIRRSYSEEK